MTHVLRTPTGETLIQVEGTLDATAGRDVRAHLRALPIGSRVVVDFGRVREFLDVGVAVMAPGLLDPRLQHVTVRGLRQHHHRLLRYFGVDLDALRGSDARSEIVDAVR